MRPTLALAVASLVTLAASAAVARENLDTEEILSDVLMDELLSEVDPKTAPGRPWAVLPQLGFSPEKGPNAGVKYTHRQFGASGLVLDFGGSYALEGQRNFGLSLVAPHLLRDWFIVAVEANYDFDPTFEFFGLGNNEVGPDELSTHEIQGIHGLFTLAFRPFDRFTLAIGGAFHDAQVERGELEDDVPSTVDAFPDLPGIRGGRASPLSISIVYNDREDVTRPTRGWRFVAKIQYVDDRLGNDFEFTRYVLDASYLLPLLTRRQVLGVRVGGEFIDAPIRDVPFWELASLGGDADLRGFFQDRFLGRSRVMINGEYRLKLFDFNFMDMWRVRIDGVAFGDMGRVFLEEGELDDQFQVDEEILPRLFEEFRYSWGGGTRIALSKALLARIDVGFSDEENALVYLTFGHTF